MDVWNEWFGLGDFCDDHGGIAGRNLRFGAKWRKEAPCLDNSQFSRTHRVIKAIGEQAAARNLQPEDIIEEWEAVFDKSKRSLSSFVRGLQALNYIPKKKNRGRKSKEAAPVAD
jgi:Transcriptional activator of glycolytic enzymes